MLVRLFVDLIVQNRRAFRCQSVFADKGGDEPDRFLPGIERTLNIEQEVLTLTPLVTLDEHRPITSEHEYPARWLVPGERCAEDRFPCIGTEKILATHFRRNLVGERLSVQKRFVLVQEPALRDPQIRAPDRFTLARTGSLLPLSIAAVD